MDTLAPFAAYAASDSTMRDDLLRDNLSLVHFVAKQLSRNMSADADLDEMVNIGTLGLMAALESFDASRGLAFSTYAVPRIRGAILDELRRQDHVPRSIRRKTREISQAREILMSRLGRTPHENEVAEVLDIDLATLWRWESEMERTVEVSLVGADDDSGRAAGPIDFLRAGTESADERIQREEAVMALRDAIVELNGQQRTVLGLYYFEELNAREIATVMGISESRVSQIRSRALAQLRTVLVPRLAA